MPFGKMAGMDNTGWMDLREPHERLRWARLRWQTKNGGATTMKAAAKSLGVEENTYSAYEREPGTSKHTALTHQRAIEFGKKFKVNWTWLLTGDGVPFELTKAQTRMLSVTAIWSEDEQERAADVVEALARKVG